MSPGRKSRAFSFAYGVQCSNRTIMHWLPALTAGARASRMRKQSAFAGGAIMKLSWGVLSALPRARSTSPSCATPLVLAMPTEFPRPLPRGDSHAVCRALG
jgi:hypothetical protein